MFRGIRLHRPITISAVLTFSFLFKPLATAADPFIYVRTSDNLGFNSNVAVIDVTSQTVAETIPLGFGSAGFIRIHPDQETAWVTTQNTNLHVIDLQSNTVIDEIPSVGTQLQQLAFNPSGEFVYVREGDVSFEIEMRRTDAPTLFQESVSLSSPSTGGIAMHPGGEFAWACDGSSITVFDPNDPPNYRERQIAVGHITRYLTFNPAGTRAYITTGGFMVPEDVLVYDVQTETLVTTIDVGEISGGLVISPDGSTLYVAVHGESPGPGGIAIIDTATDSVTNFIDQFGTSQLAISDDGQLLFATTDVISDDRVSFIDTQTESIVGFVEFGAVGGLAFVDKALYFNGFESD